MRIASLNSVFLSLEASRRNWILESSYATPGLFQGSVPMPVGAVNDGGKGKKGKSKMTGDKGKDKSKHRTRRWEWWSTASAIPRLLLTLLEVRTQTRGLSKGETDSMYITIATRQRRFRSVHKNSYRIHANPLVHYVSLVVEDDMPVRLSSRSPLKLLDRRLDELALPQ